MEQRKLWLIAGALYISAAIGAVAMNAASSDGVPHERTDARQPAPAAASETDEARAAIPHDAPFSEASDTIEPPTKVAAAVLCSASEREAIADAALTERDEVLAQVDDVKRELLADKGLGTLTGAVIPDDVEAEMDTWDAVGETALDEIDATIGAATEACEAGDDPAAILATL